MSFLYQKNVLHVEAVSCPTITKAVGTPVYVYSSALLRSKANEFIDAFKHILPPAHQPTICFAVKACSNVHILKLLKDQGIGADVVSGGELERALKAGINSKMIVFSGVGKTDAEIEAAFQANIKQLNIESIPELNRIAALSARTKKSLPLVLRINPDVDAKTHAKITTGLGENKFGVNYDQVAGIFEHALTMPHINLCGLSMHIGSQITDFSTFQQAFTRLATLVTTLRAQGHVIDRIDLGGGIGITYNAEKIPSMTDYATLIRDIIVPLGTEIILEPGRSMVGNCGLLLSEVIFEKIGTTKNFLVIDAAMNDLMRPALYDSYHGIEPVILTPDAPPKTYDVVGPVCESTDIFTKDRILQTLGAGDLVAFRDAGAYSAVMSGTYNTRPLVPEVLVDGDNFKVIRKRWSVADMLALED